MNRPVGPAPTTTVRTGAPGGLGAGDDEPVALADRIVAIGSRVGPLFGALEVAVGMDPAARELVVESRQRRLDDAGKVVRRLRDLDALATGITYQEAVHLVWLAMDPALFDRLVRVRRWSTSRFEEWLADMLCRQVLA